MKSNNIYKKNEVFMKKINLIGPLKLIHQEVNFTLPTFFVDGGLIHARNFQDKKESFGDGDSLTEKSHKIDYKLPIEKNISDFLYALKHVIEHDMIHLHGFYGKRQDHQLSIIGDLLNLLKSHPEKEIKLHNTEDLPWIFSSKTDYSFFHQGSFSILSLQEQKIEILGAKYPLEDKSVTIKPLSSIGLSNIGHGQVFIKAKKPYLLIPLKHLF